MLKDASANFISVCRRIATDGQLSGEEVWYLANWLNDHPEAAEVWPGDQFVEPLNDCFRDGELDLNEMVHIAELIARVEREYADQQTPFVDESDLEHKITAPVLPMLPRRTQVHSRASEDLFSIDLTAHTCTCPEWIDIRRTLPAGHFGRLCIHLADGFMESAEDHLLQPWQYALFEDCHQRGRGTVPQDDWNLIHLPESQVLVSVGSSDWSNVFAPEEEAYARYGYHLAERRWAYGLAPVGAGTISKVILQLKDTQLRKAQQKQ